MALTSSSKAELDVFYTHCERMLYTECNVQRSVQHPSCCRISCGTVSWMIVRCQGRRASGGVASATSERDTAALVHAAAAAAAACRTALRGINHGVVSRRVSLMHIVYRQGRALVRRR
jgi:hypothetical protein